MKRLIAVLPLVLILVGIIGIKGSAAESFSSDILPDSVTGGFHTAMIIDPDSSDTLEVSTTNFSSIALPGRIEAESYKVGSRGVGYYDTSDGNAGKRLRGDDVDIEAASDEGGGFNVGWIKEGEWLAYDIEVAEDGLYDIMARVASAGKGPKTLHVEVDGVDVTGPMKFLPTGGWQLWTTVTVQDVELTAGSHNLRIAMDSDDFNINYVDVMAVAAPECAASIPGDPQAPAIESVDWSLHRDNSLVVDFSVELEAPAQVWIEYTSADGQADVLTTAVSESSESAHDLEVMRLRAGTHYCFQAFAQDPGTGAVSESFSGSFRAGPMPPGLVGAGFNQVLGQPTYDLTLMDFNDADFKGFVAIDQDAQIVWYFEHHRDTFEISQKDGYNLVFNELEGVNLFEIMPDGTVVDQASEIMPDETICMPHGPWHHEMLIRPDDRVLTLGSAIRTINIDGEERLQTGDTIVVWDQAAGTTEVAVSLFDLLDPATHRTPASNIQSGFYWRGCDGEQTTSEDWTHANSLDVAQDGNILMSSRHLNQVLAIEPDFGGIAWILGGPGSDFTFPNPADRFYHQHTAQELPNGNILLFDNGNTRPGEDGGEYSRALELELDMENMTATKVWEYRHTTDLFAQCCSSVTRLDDGNTVIVFGSDHTNDICCRVFTMVEADPDGEAVSVTEMATPIKNIQYRVNPINSINGESKK